MCGRPRFRTRRGSATKLPPGSTHASCEFGPLLLDLQIGAQMSDPFERFAEECGLRLTAEPLGVAPRDVLAPPSTLEQHFLVSLSRTASDAAAVRLVFLTPIVAADGPSIRDVLWWLAGDAWVLEQANRRLESWAATYGYPPVEEATARMFELSVRQSRALAAVLGEPDMRRLLALYEAEVAPSRPR